MTEILFYHLRGQKLEGVLPALLEKSLERGWKVVVQGSFEERIEAHREWCSHEELHCRSTWSSAMIAYDFVAPHESQQTSNEK